MLFKDEELHKKIDTSHSSIKTQIDSLHTAVKQLEENQSKNITELQNQVAQFSVGFAAEVQNIRTELSAIKQAREDVEKSSRSFTETQKKIDRMIQEQLSTAIAESIQKLKLDADHYTNIKKDISLIAPHLQKLVDEISKLTAISSQIKQSDFQLVKYARELKNSDDERVKLMKQVDELQRLVGKMRRSQQ